MIFLLESKFFAVVIESNNSIGKEKVAARGKPPDPN